MAESYLHEKAPERRCELFRWIVAIPGAQSLKSAPSATWLVRTRWDKVMVVR